MTSAEDLESPPARTRWSQRGLWQFLAAWITLGAVSLAGSYFVAMVIVYDLVLDRARCHEQTPPCTLDTVLSDAWSVVFCVGLTYIASGAESLVVGLRAARRPIVAAALSGAATYLIGLLITTGLLLYEMDAAVAR